MMEALAVGGSRKRRRGDMMDLDLEGIPEGTETGDVS